jgi:DNA-binding CsgD family transcriptional regulator
MGRLTASDIVKFSRVLQVIYRPCDLNVFAEHLLPAVCSLVPADLVGYRRMSPLTAISHGRYLPREIQPDTALEQAFRRHAHEHPLLGRQRRRGHGSALKISDFWTVRQFHDRGLYQEVYRSLGIEDVMAIRLPTTPHGTVGLSFHRHARTFSERDRLLMDLLRPHVTQAHLNAAVITQMRDIVTANARVLETSGHAFIVLGCNWRIRVATLTARRQLRRYFEGNLRHDRLPAGLERWARSQHRALLSTDRVELARGPFTVEHAETRLTVRFISDSSRILLGLQEQQLSASLTSLQALGLTKREAEILRWVSDGKTNHDVATVLNTRSRTVAKHLERIFEKLGVETRTAATRIALTSQRA